MKIKIIFLLISFSLISACGGGSGSDNANDNPPEISGKPASSVRAGEFYSFRPDISDADGNLLTISVANLPVWAFFDAGSGELSGFPEKIHYGKHEDIVITVSDGSNSVSLTFSLDVLPPLLTVDNFTSQGVVTPTADGFQSNGVLVMNIDGEEKNFDGDLTLSFDEEGNLLDMVGETIVPQSISDNLSLDAGVTATVGMLSGAEISANPDFGITLKDDLNFFVYHFAQSLDITVGDQRDGSGTPGSLTLSTPLGGEILLITDPSDVFYYYFASLPVIGNAGTGASQNGFIPFIPSLDYAELGSFDGHIIEKLGFSLGVKIFDFFKVSGTRIVHLPIPGKIDYDDLFATPIAFKMGINGVADFDFSILGFGLFSFNLAQTSATLEVSLDKQQMAMQTVIAPDISWVPASFPFVPATETVGEWFINGDGSFNASLSSSFKSTIPDAMLTGSMEIDPVSVVLRGTVGTGDKTLGATATFFDTGVSVEVDVYADFSSGIDATVTTAFDDITDEVQRAIDDLQKATADFELELSLNGLRTSLPVIANNAILVLNPVPGDVRNAVDTAVVNYVNNYEVCTFLGCTNPLDPLVNENALGNEKGEVARKAAADAIAPLKTALTNVKNAANASDDVFRAAIKNALQQAYNSRTFSKRITITHSFPLGLGSVTLYNKTTTKTVLSTANANAIKFALDNIDNIPITDGIRISAQQIFDALPVEDAINTARQELEDGLAQIPTLDGVGYTVDTGVYSAYAILDGVQHEVFFNVLSPGELASGIGRLIADQSFN